MIEQASVLSGEEKSLIDSVWSLILGKSNQNKVEGFDFAAINDMLCFLVTRLQLLCFRKIVPIKLWHCIFLLYLLEFFLYIIFYYIKNI